MRFSIVTSSFIAMCLIACSGTAPPTIQPIDDQVVAVGGGARLEISASSEGGGAITYSFDSNMPNADDRGELTQRPNGTGLFVLRPLAADVGTWAYDFTASQGGLSNTVTVQIEVRSAVGAGTAPRFLSPLGKGTVLNVPASGTACLDLDVIVDDADTVSVTLAMEDPKIEGAMLTKVDGKKAHFKWCPTANQIQADDRYRLRLSADDRDNPPQILDYTIVLMKQASMSCPGTPATVSSTPQNESTLVGLSVLAEVRDDNALKKPPLLYHSTTRPAATPNLAQMSQVEMILLDGTTKNGTWGADVPNPVATMPAGSSATIYYVVVAVDADDPAGSCNHTTQSQVYMFTVTNPGGNGGLPLCQPCTADTQCGGANDHCLFMGTQGDAFCGKACTASSDCGTGYTCPTAVVESVDGKDSRQCIPVSGSCIAAQPTCMDDAAEENDTRLEAQAGSVLAPQAAPRQFVSCPLAGGSDDDWYKLEVTTAGKIQAAIKGTFTSDLDLVLFRGDGQYITASAGPTDEEGLTRLVQPGIYYLQIKAFPILGGTGRVERNPYSLTYTQTAGNSCVDDRFEDDDSPNQARPQPLLWGTVVRNNQICSGDDDWFKVELARGETFIVDLFFEQANPNQNLDLHFHDSRSVDLTPCTEANPSTCSVFQGQGLESNEHYEFTVSNSEPCNPLCTYYVRVHGFAGSENTYDIRFDLVDE